MSCLRSYYRKHAPTFLVPDNYLPTLCSAILTIFQIDGSQQPITRTAALASLGSGLWSLIYGGVYVVRFQSMKDMIKASRWAEAAQDTVQAIFWNVWVFLALPAVRDPLFRRKAGD